VELARKFFIAYQKVKRYKQEEVSVHRHLLSLSFSHKEFDKLCQFLLNPLEIKECHQVALVNEFVELLSVLHLSNHSQQFSYTKSQLYAFDQEF